jgi:hypothetical protein
MQPKFLPNSQNILLKKLATLGQGMHKCRHMCMCIVQTPPPHPHKKTFRTTQTPECPSVYNIFVEARLETSGEGGGGRRTCFEKRNYCYESMFGMMVSHSVETQKKPFWSVRKFRETYNSRMAEGWDQFCGSGSVSELHGFELIWLSWIRIRIVNADPYP